VNGPPAAPPLSRPGAQLTRWDGLIVVAMLLAWGTFFAAERTASRGYHLEDDHEILRMAADLRNGSFPEVVGSWLANDVRFRPVYYVHRIAEALVFGEGPGWPARSAGSAAERYDRGAREAQVLLDGVARLPAGSRVVVAGGLPGASEHFWAMHWYLALRAPGLRVAYLLVEPGERITPFQEQLLASFRTGSFFARFQPGAGEAPPDAIAVLDGEDERFLRQSAGWFDATRYHRDAFGAHTLYTPRGP